MKRIVACTSLAALALTACGSDDDDGIAIEGAWARTSAEGQTTGAVYLVITADEADRLVAASVPSSVAATAEIHEVVIADMSEDGESDMGDDGESDMGGTDPQMRMQELVDGLALPAGETITLEPGGSHVMLLELAAPLEAGDQIELTLDFENADDTTVTVEVAESAP